MFASLSQKQNWKSNQNKNIFALEKNSPQHSPTDPGKIHCFVPEFSNCGEETAKVIQKENILIEIKCRRQADRSWLRHGSGYFCPLPTDKNQNVRKLAI